MNLCPLHSLLTELVAHTLPLECPMTILNEILLIGSSNGLICVSIGEDQFLLWNPATRESKELPYFLAGVEDLRYRFITSYGFGFDESSGDYKVYALFQLANWEDITFAMGKVYSLKSDSWGETRVYYNESPLKGIIDDPVGKFARGKLHWVCKTESKWEIVCLDLKSEAFGVLEKPSLLEDYFVLRLGVLDGCLCLFCDCLDWYGIWIWKKDGVEEYSWVKFANISYSSDSWMPSFMTQFSTLSPPLSTPLCMLPNGEVLFTYRSNFMIYNPKDNGFRKRYIDNFDDVLQVEVYAESLVSLVLTGDDGNGEQERQP